MSLQKNKYGQIGTPRVYIDFVQYAKAIGEVEATSILNATSDSHTSDFWNFDPTKTQYCDVEVSNFSVDFTATFKSRSTNKRPFSHLLQGINYFGILGHNLSVAETYNKIDDISIYCSGQYDTTGEYLRAEPQNYFGIVGTEDGPGQGYTMIGCENWAGEESNWDDSTEKNAYEEVSLSIGASDGLVAGDRFALGNINIGRYMDFPVSPDLNVKLEYEYDGIQSKITKGGSRISNINYYKRPDWGEYASWVHIPSTSTLGAREFNTKSVSPNGRRKWTIKFSFIDEKDTFPLWSEFSMAANYDSNMWSNPDIYEDIHRESIVGTFLTFTLGGQIPFIFQPNKDVQEFAICVLDTKSISIDTVAFGVYSVSMTFREVW